MLGLFLHSACLVIGIHCVGGRPVLSDTGCPAVAHFVFHVNLRFNASDVRSSSGEELREISSRWNRREVPLSLDYAAAFKS